MSVVMHETVDADGNVESRKWYDDGQEITEAEATARSANDSTLRTRAEEALADLRLLANSSGTLTGAQLSNGARLCARVLIALVRLQLRRFDATA